MEFDWSQVVNPFLVFLGTLLTGLGTMLANVLLQQARIRWAEFKRTQPVWLSAMIQEAARLAVLSVEQQYRQVIEPDIVERKNKARDEALAWLEQMGVPSDLVDTSALDVALESAVHMELNSALDYIFVEDDTEPEV